MQANHETGRGVDAGAGMYAGDHRDRGHLDPDRADRSVSAMNAVAFRAALGRLDYSQRGFAEFVKVDERSVRRWATGTGDHPIPGWVAVVVTLLEECRALAA